MFIVLWKMVLTWIILLFKTLVPESAGISYTYRSQKNQQAFYTDRVQSYPVPLLPEDVLYTIKTMGSVVYNAELQVFPASANMIPILETAGTTSNGRINRNEKEIWGFPF